MSEEQLKELQKYNLEYLEAQASEEMFGGDFTSAVELKQANKEIERLEENNKRLKKKNKELECKNKILSDFAKHIYTTYGYDSKLGTWTSWGLKYDLDTYFDDIDYATNFELNDEEIFRNKGE